MMNSYSTEDAGRSGVGLHPLQHDSTTFSFVSCNASNKVFPIHMHMGGCYGADRLGPQGALKLPTLCTPMPSDSLPSTF